MKYSFPPKVLNKINRWIFNVEWQFYFRLLFPPNVPSFKFLFFYFSFFFSFLI